ncbi:MAG: peptidylprolyl isomerase [Campylobacterales bacterium]
MVWKDIKSYNLSEDELKKAKFAKIVTNKGEMIFELFYKDAPENVANFAHLANSGFYDNLAFHRVIPGFVAQGGCPKGDGTSGPDWRVKCEVDTNLNKHKKGALSMAHAGKDTGGSQFFICFGEQPHLDGEHTVFGQIIDKKDFKVLDSIEVGDKIEKIEVFEDFSLFE